MSQETCLGAITFLRRGFLWRTDESEVRVLRRLRFDAFVRLRSTFVILVVGRCRQ
jgi:hypothetical protein